MKILFVCTGNDCRSMMTEAVFNKKPQDIRISDAFTGIDSDTDSVILLNKRRVGLAVKKAVQFTASILDSLNYTSDAAYHLVPALKSVSDDVNGCICIPCTAAASITGGSSVCERAFDMIDNLIFLLINKIKEDMSIL